MREITGAIIGSFYDVHSALGFGYRELIHTLALERDLRAKGHRVDREVAVMIHFRGEPLAPQTIDMVIDQKVIVEAKSTEVLHPEADRQLFGYLCASTLEVGLLLHFGRKADFHRVIHENKYEVFGVASCSPFVSVQSVCVRVPVVDARVAIESRAARRP